MKIVSRLLFSLFILLLTVPADSQEVVNSKLTSVYLHNFIKYVNWSKHQSTDPFIIGIFDDDETYQNIRSSLEGTKVEDAVINVVEFHTVSEINHCDLLFIPSSRSSAIQNIASSLDQKQILIVTTGQQMTKKGAALSLMMVNDKLKFELSEYNIKKAGLKVSNQLMMLAVIVD